MSQLCERPIKAVRKRHYCVGCGRHVLPGEPAINWCGMNDGEFNSVYYHPECRVAELALNKLHDTFQEEEWQALNEAEREDYPWLKRKHPKAYLRLVAPAKYFERTPA